MIRLERLPEPEVLEKNRETWTKKFIASGKRRPPSKQYGHEEIRERLRAMSHHKCFYCEGSVKGEASEEVDHFIEVSFDPCLAFEWENLYLSCKGCNGKLPHEVVPVSSCLDPCDPTCEPEEHLTFDDEQIRSRNSSVLGDLTIRKYKLGRDGLDLNRSKQLKLFLKTLATLQRLQIADGGRPLRPEELEVLRGFADRSRPFSLMFSVYLGRAGL